MKHKIIVLVALFAIIISISWGYKGHRAVATIAQNHLTSDAAKGVNALLNSQSMAEVSTWADEIKNQSQYNTSSWHFLNLPSGLTHEQFVKQVYGQDKDNVFTAIMKAEGMLSNKQATLQEKQEALKFLIHLVGDAHQPMHISRAEDKGGNTIQVRFDGKGTNLHSLWDSKLIDHEGINEAEFVKECDNATEQDIKHGRQINQ